MHNRKASGLLCLVVAAAFCVGGPARLSDANAAQPVVSLSEIRSEKIILQQWELSCAAAALATVLRYQHGIPVTERVVALGLINRQEYLVNPELVRWRQGFSLLDMKRYTDYLGLQGQGLGQLTLEDLMDMAPVIVPIDRAGFPHFVIFRGATPNEVLLGDPAFGNVSLSREDFLEQWIPYKDLGRVGFVVQNPDAPSHPGALKAEQSDFVILRPTGSQ